MNAKQPFFVHDKAQIEAYLRAAPLVHIYHLGDLDAFYWPYTCWYALPGDGPGGISALLLLYAGMDLPVVLSDFSPGATGDGAAALLKRCLALLPGRFYAHLAPGQAEILAGRYRLEPHGAYWKMGLTEPARLAEYAAQHDMGGVEQLGPEQAGELLAFYDEAHPEHWFDPRMLATGCYYGVRAQGRLVAAAGVHVYSPQYGVAALGNIVTHPDWRGCGLGTLVTARLCQSLQASVGSIGLNVRGDNTAAIRAYTRLGFTRVADYEEYMVEPL